MHYFYHPLLIREKCHCNIFTIGKNSVQWDFSLIMEPLVLENSAMGFFSDHKSSPTSSIPVSPNRHGINQSKNHQLKEFAKIIHSRTCKLMRMTGGKSIARWAQRPSPVWGSIYDHKKITLHYFYHWFQNQ